MRLKKGDFHLVHKTSREIGDGSFHGTVFVCVCIWVLFLARRLLPSVSPSLIHALFLIKNPEGISRVCPASCNDLCITTFLHKKMRTV